MLDLRSVGIGAVLVGALLLFVVGVGALVFAAAWWPIPVVLAFLLLIAAFVLAQKYRDVADYFTGYDRESGRYHRLAVVRSVVMAVAAVVALIVGILVQNWAKERWFGEVIWPGWAAGAAVILLFVFVWHTLVVEPFEDIEVLVRPYLPGWVLIYLFFLLRWYTIPVWAFFVGMNRRSASDWAIRLAVFAGTCGMIWFFGFMDPYTAQESWAFVRNRVLPAYYVFGLLYMVMAAIRYADTYVYVDASGNVWDVDSTFMRGWSGLWRNNIRRLIVWEDVDLSEEKYWRVPGFKRFAPLYRLSLTAEEGYPVSIYAMTPDAYTLIGDASAQRKAREAAFNKVVEKRTIAAIEAELKEGEVPTLAGSDEAHQPPADLFGFGPESNAPGDSPRPDPDPARSGDDTAPPQAPS